jgi:hypothetical protein
MFLRQHGSEELQLLCEFLTLVMPGTNFGMLCHARRIKLGALDQPFFSNPGKLEPW